MTNILIFSHGVRVRLLRDVPEIPRINPFIPRGTLGTFRRYNEDGNAWISTDDPGCFLCVPSHDLELVEDEHKENLHLDVSLEKARALHRVWRALNDGDCPKCHRFCPAGASGMDRIATEESMLRPGAFPVLAKLRCPNCSFEITGEEIRAIQKEFAPAMDRSMKIFEEWRAERKEQS